MPGGTFLNLYKAWLLSSAPQVKAHPSHRLPFLFPPPFLGSEKSHREEPGSGEAQQTQGIRS